MKVKLEAAGRKVALWIGILIVAVIAFKLVVGVIKGFIFTLIIAALAVLALVALNYGLGSRRS